MTKQDARPEGTDASGGDRHEGPERGDEEAGLGLAYALYLLIRHRRLLIGLSLVGALVGLAAASLGPTEYRAQATFLPGGVEVSFPGLTGVATMDGPARSDGEPSSQGPVLPGSGVQFRMMRHGPDDVGPPAGLYRRLLDSRSVVLEALVRRSYAPPDGAGEGNTLVERYGLTDLPEDRALRRAVRRLASAVQVIEERGQAGVGIRVTASSAWLAEVLAAAVIEEIESFEQRWRRQQLEDRIAVLRGLIGADEASGMRAGIGGGDSAAGDPLLEEELRRLQARKRYVAEASATRVLERPDGSARPVPRKRLALSVVGLLVGATLAGLVMLGRQYLAGLAAEDHPHYRLVREAWAEATGRAGSDGA